MQFAIRYPERTSALILLVPHAWVPPSDASAEAAHSNPFVPNAFVLDVLLKSDFVMWALMKVAPAEMLASAGVPKGLQATMTPEQNARAAEVLRLILPVSQRRQGMANDAMNSVSLGRYPVEDIRATALIIDTRDGSTSPGSNTLPRTYSTPDSSLTTQAGISSLVMRRRDGRHLWNF